ncbi:protein-L-isoaspartate O-methyltransferase [Halobacteriaceae archaeon GCM10025711]
MDYAGLRDNMVSSLEHETKGLVRTDRVARAMRAVPRHRFVDVDAEHRAYMDQAYEHRGTRVLAPSTAAWLLEGLAPEPDDSVLVVGAGVGYTVAVVAEIVGARNVHALDITRPLVLDARQNLSRTGYGDVLVDCRDGASGLPEYAPYDRILVEAAAVRPPGALVRQLAPDGRLVMPVGTGEQSLVAVEDGDVVEEFGGASFDPLLVDGEQHGTVLRNRTEREERERAAREAQARRGWEQDWIDWDHRL